MSGGGWTTSAMTSTAWSKDPLVGQIRLAVKHGVCLVGKCVQVPGWSFISVTPASRLPQAKPFEIEFLGITLSLAHLPFHFATLQPFPGSHHSFLNRYFRTPMKFFSSTSNIKKILRHILFSSGCVSNFRFCS